LAYLLALLMALHGHAPPATGWERNHKKKREGEHDSVK
jgi:hypothetical protein